MPTLKSQLQKESVMSTLDLLASESKDFNHFLQKFKKQFPKIAVTKSTLSGLKKMFDEMKKQMMEVAPEGWEGTVKAMKKDKSIDNPWALAHWMKGQGYTSHKKESIKEEETFTLIDDNPKDDIASIKVQIETDGGMTIKVGGMFHAEGEKVEILREKPELEEELLQALQTEFQNAFRTAVHSVLGEPFGIAESEDCGCGQTPTNEQPIHTSNKLSLKVGLQK